MTRFNIISTLRILLVLSTSPILTTSSPAPVPQLLPTPLTFSNFLDSSLRLPPPNTPITDYFRHVLTSFFSTDGPHDKCLSNLPPDFQRFVNSLISPGDVNWESPGLNLPLARPRKRHNEERDPLEAQRNRILNFRRQTTPVIYEDVAGTQPMQVQISLPFQNWGLSIRTTPLYTFRPRSIIGLQNLVRWAREEDRKIRVAGGTHSWASLFADEGGVLVSFIDGEVGGGRVPRFIELEKDVEAEGEFGGVEVVEAIAGGVLVKVGAAVTNEELRRWQVKEKWSLEANVMPLEVTFVGVITTLCHGSGASHRTISDYIRSVTYVDANGSLQTITSPDHLRVAAGSFGLLGIITSVTVFMTPTQYAILSQVKEPIWRSVPLPDGFPIPILSPLSRITTGWQLTTPDEQTRIKNTFASRAQSAGYSQWLWFPHHPEAIVLAWNPTSDSSASIEQYPTLPDLLMQHLSTWFINCVAEDPRFLLLPRQTQAAFLGYLSHAFVAPYSGSPLTTSGAPQVERIKTPTPNAHHWRRGMSNLRVRHFGVEIPIPSTTSGGPDWSIAWEAWWIAVAEILSDAGGGVRHALEMRMMGGSEMVMAPQRGNEQWGTVSIEVMTTMSAADDGSWRELIGRLGLKWMELGRKVRPHWAKEWEPIRINGQPWLNILREETFKEEIKEFKDILADIGQDQGWTVEDVRKRFGNQMLEQLFWG